MSSLYVSREKFRTWCAGAFIIVTAVSCTQYALIITLHSAINHFSVLCAYAHNV